MIRLRPRSIAWLLAGVVAIVAWTGSQRESTGPARGTAFCEVDHQKNAAPWVWRGTSEGSRRLRVATFNIHAGKGSDGARDLERTAATLEAEGGFDLVGLNEVWGPAWWRPVDQAQVLGRSVRKTWLFAPTEHRWWSEPFGNAVLAAVPVRGWQRIPLPRASKTFRNVVLCEVDCDGTDVHLLTTHLDPPGKSAPNDPLRTVSELFLELAEPAVLMGDFNADRNDPDVRALLDHPGVIDAVGAVLRDEDPRRIDWILCRGMKPIGAGLIDEGASDHPLVWAELEIEAAP